MWIVDPLDGTTNFLHGVPVWAVSIAAAVDGVLEAAIVLDVPGDEQFEAVRDHGASLGGRPLAVSAIGVPEFALIGTGFPFKNIDRIDEYQRQFAHIAGATSGIRRPGAAAVDLAWVAAGRFDGFWEQHLSAWDMAAGTLLVREAGGVVTNFEGSHDMLRHTSVIAGNPAMHCLAAGNLCIGPSVMALVALGSVIACARPPAPSPGSEESLRAALATYDSAWLAKDRPTVERTLASRVHLFHVHGGPERQGGDARIPRGHRLRPHAVAPHRCAREGGGVDRRDQQQVGGRGTVSRRGGARRPDLWPDLGLEHRPLAPAGRALHQPEAVRARRPHERASTTRALGRAPAARALARGSRVTAALARRRPSGVHLGRVRRCALVEKIGRIVLRSPKRSALHPVAEDIAARAAALRPLILALGEADDRAYAAVMAARRAAAGPLASVPLHDAELAAARLQVMLMDHCVEVIELARKLSVRSAPPSAPTLPARGTSPGQQHGVRMAMWKRTWRTCTMIRARHRFAPRPTRHWNGPCNPPDAWPLPATARRPPSPLVVLLVGVQ